MEWGRYRILTKRHVAVIFALTFLAGMLVIMLAALLPYAYKNAMAVANKKVPVCCTDRSNKVVSFTFENLQGDANTAEIMEILKEYNISATFFVTGEWVGLYPDSALAIYESGHEVMNCADEYTHLPALSRIKMMQEIKSCNDKIQAVTGERPTLFRAPYGDYDNALMETLDSLHMTGIQWDIDSMDFKDISAGAITHRVTSLVCSGSIVRFQSQSKETVQALPGIIESLEKDGYTFLTVTDMIYTEDYTLNNDGRQIKTAHKN